MGGKRYSSLQGRKRGSKKHRRGQRKKAKSESETTPHLSPICGVMDADFDNPFPKESESSMELTESNPGPETGEEELEQVPPLPLMKGAERGSREGEGELEHVLPLPLIKGAERGIYFTGGGASQPQSVGTASHASVVTLKAASASSLNARAMKSSHAKKPSSGNPTVTLIAQDAFIVKGSDTSPKKGFTSINPDMDDDGATINGCITFLNPVPQQQTEYHTPDTASGPDMRHVQEVTEVEVHTPTHDSESSVQKVWQWKWKIVFLFIPLLLVGLVAMPVCSYFVWSPLSHLSSHDVQHREGNIPILAQVNSFLIEGVTIQQETDSLDSLHKISIYMADFTCNNLPILSETVSHHDVTHIENINPIYMLPNSRIEIDICASTKNTENNPFIIYILRTVEDFLFFNEHQLHKWDYHRTIPVGKDGNSTCTYIKKEIREPDYYSVRFVHSLDVAVTYNLTMMIKQVDINAINATLVGVLDPENDDDDDDQQTDQTISFGTKKLCLFADIQESVIQSTNNYTTLDTRLEPRYDAALGITVSMTVVFFLLILALEVLTCYLVKRKCHRCGRSSYTPLV